MFVSISYFIRGTDLGMFVAISDCIRGTDLGIVVAISYFIRGTDLSCCSSAVASFDPVMRGDTVRCLCCRTAYWLDH